MPSRRVYALLVVFLTLVGLGFVNWLYIRHVDAQAERRNLERAREICGLITVLDDAYRGTPPTTQLGRNVADEIHAYRQRLGC